VWSASFVLLLGAAAASMPTAQAATGGVGGNGQAPFTLSITPAAQGLPAGSSVSYGVMTSAGTGVVPETVSLSASGLPSGVTASFVPANVIAGQSSTLTLTASSSAMNGTTTFTVVGTGAQSAATATADVTISGGGGGVGCPPGTIQIGGICIPEGCSYAPATSDRGAPAAAAFASLLALAAWRRRRRRH
jgi:MYXO-CTERM domain-containing protein